MIALIWFVLAVLASLFNSKSRLEADNFKVSVVSSDPTITAARASLNARDEISPKTRRSRH
jgi:hypothetical protein